MGTVQDGLWYLDPTTGVGKAGVAAPIAVTPILAAGTATGLTGTYKGAYTFVNSLGHESNKSPISNSITLADEKANWSFIGVGPTGTVSRRFYRTVANGSLYLYHSTIADNTTTVITGDAVPDSSLGAEAPLTNFPPPEGIRHVSSNAVRVFLCTSGAAVLGDNGFTLYACAIDPDTGEPNFEAYPPELSLTFPVTGGIDLLQASIALPNGDLYVASRFNIWKVTGDVGLEPVIDKVADVGFFSPFAGVLTPYGLFFVDYNAEVWIYDGETLKDVDFPVHEALRTFITTWSLGETDYPFVTYHPLTKQVHIDLPNDSSCFIYDLESEQWNTMRTGFVVSHYSERKKTMFGAQKDLSEILEGDLNSYSFKGAQYPVQVAEFYPVYPEPGKSFLFNKIKMEVQELPIVANVPPTLKVEWAVDGDSLYTSSYVDLSPKNIRGAIAYGTPYTSSTILRTTATKTVEVPIHRIAKSVSVRLSTVNNNSSYTNGMQIYKIWLDVDDLDEPSKDDRKFRLDKEL